MAKKAPRDSLPYRLAAAPHLAAEEQRQAGTDIQRRDSPGPLQHGSEVAMTDKRRGRGAEVGERQDGEQRGDHHLECGQQGGD